LNTGVNSTLLLYRPRDVIDKQLEMCRDRCIKWIRCTFEWDFIQPDINVPADWTNIDYAVKKAAECGINILGILAGSPKWANGGKTPNYPPTDLEAWRLYCFTVMSRYPAVRTWEIWNEQNCAFFMGDALDYVELVKATPKLAGNKNIFGGLAGVPGYGAGKDFLKDCLMLGVADYVDAVAYHPYAQLLPLAWWIWNRYQPQEAIALKCLSEVKALVNKYKPMEVWLTELGWTTAGLWPWQTVSETLQRDYWVRTRKAYEGQVDAIFWYDLWEMAAKNDPGNSWAVNHYGLLRNDFTPKPIWSVFLP